MQKPRTQARGREQEKGVRAVEEYLAKLPEDTRKTLEKLRKDIRAAAPDATEGIFWSMPGFRQNGYLVGYAAFKDHVSFFPAGATTVRKFAAELKKYSTSKGTIRFHADEPIPSALVRRMVKARVAENEAKPTHKRR
ncbi:MAG TPA: DUF1801 domain-containing protein [bacterium]|nr:DUF1801 domain-containing protein [bacterium]